jgi:mRNA interferase RelE/StbE
MARYTIGMAPAAARALAGQDRPVRERLIRAIDALANDPRPAGRVKLHGAEDAWRIRVGDYRIIYSIEDGKLLILVLRIGHRREVYR